MLERLALIYFNDGTGILPSPTLAVDYAQNKSVEE
jgi:hypothetical protein